MHDFKQMADGKRIFWYCSCYQKITACQFTFELFVSCENIKFLSAGFEPAQGDPHWISSPSPKPLCHDNLCEAQTLLCWAESLISRMRALHLSLQCSFDMSGLTNARTLCQRLHLILSAFISSNTDWNELKISSSSLLVPPFIDGADDVTVSTVILNSPLELECHATGTPAPVIK